MRWLFQLLFVVALILTIRDTSAAPPRAEALRELSAMAHADAANGIPRRTADAVTLWHRKWPELDVMEAARAYDEEYTRVERDSVLSLPRSVRDVVAIAFGIACLVLALLKDAASKLVMRLLSAAFNWIYPRVASSRLLRPLALRTYRNGLSGALRWIKPTIGPNRKIDAQQVYVPLKLAGHARSGTTDALAIVRDHERLMILGAPGAGKSMLLRHLAFTYAQGFESKVREPLPVLLELFRLTSDPTIEGLTTQITEALSRAHFPNAGSFVKHALQRGELMLLFDGLDEVAAQNRAAVVLLVKDALETYPRCKAVITCRSAVYHNEFSGIATTYEIAEFTDQQIRRFLRMYMTRVAPERSVEHLVQTLRDRPAILSLARNPLLLSIIEYLYSETPIVLPHSRAEFYQKALDVLLQLRDEERGLQNQYRALDKRAVLQRLSLEFQKHVQAATTRDRRTLEASVVHAETRAVLPSLGLSERDAGPLLDEIIDRSSLLLRVDGGASYQFAHLTLQEFLAAEALRSKESLLLERWRAEPSAWREPAKLWCNLSGNATSFLREVRAHDRLMAVECLADAQEVEPELANDLIAEAQSRLASTEVGKAWGAALAAIAASARARSETALGFLLASLRQPGDVSRSLAAAEALSLTNLGQAASALADSISQGGSDAHVRALTRMGDLAAPHLLRLARAGKTELVDQLASVGTPVAARMLADQVWESERDPVTQRAAFNLGALLRNPQTAEELSDYRLPPHAENGETLPWVFGPFAVSPVIKQLAARVAYVISRAASDRFRENPPAVDPRIAVPVCAIAWADDAPAVAPSGHLARTLEAADPDGLEARYLQELATASSFSARQVMLIQSLPAPMQSDLVRRRLSQRRPTPQDWLQLYDKTTYELGLSWHHRVIIVLTLVVAVLAVWGVRDAFGDSSSTARVLVIVLLILPLFLWIHHAGTPRGPFFLYSVLLGGPLALLAQRQHARLLLAGTHRNLAGGFVLTVAGMLLLGASAFAGVFLGEQVSIWRGVGDETLAIRLGGGLGIVAGAAGGFAAMGAGRDAESAGISELLLGGVALLLYTAVVGFFVAALVGTLVGFLCGAPGTGSLTGAVVGPLVAAVAALAAGIFVLLERLLKSFDNPGSNQLALLLTAPLSLWLPIAAVFVTSLAGRYLAPLLVILGWIFASSITAGLWWRSRALENRARNPLRGILDPAAQPECPPIEEGSDDVLRTMLGRTVPMAK